MSSSCFVSSHACLVRNVEQTLSRFGCSNERSTVVSDVALSEGCCYTGFGYSNHRRQYHYYYRLEVASLCHC